MWFEQYGTKHLLQYYNYHFVEDSRVCWASPYLLRADYPAPIYFGKSIKFIFCSKPLVSIIIILFRSVYTLGRMEFSADLYNASNSGNIAKVTEILKYASNIVDGRDSSYSGATALFAASQSGRVDVVKLLLAANANVNLPDNEGKTPLYAASERMHLPVVKLLISANANVNLSTNDGKTPLSVAATKGNLDITSALIAAGANVNVIDTDGKTPLIITANQNGNIEVTKALLAAQANVNKSDNYGATPLRVALDKGRLDLVRYTGN